jgi:hypothetical protein
MTVVLSGLFQEEIPRVCVAAVCSPCTVSTQITVTERLSWYSTLGRQTPGQPGVGQCQHGDWHHQRHASAMHICMHRCLGLQCYVQLAPMSGVHAMCPAVLSSLPSGALSMCASHAGTAACLDCHASIHVAAVISADPRTGSFIWLSEQGNRCFPLTGKMMEHARTLIIQSRSALLLYCI